MIPEISLSTSRNSLTSSFWGIPLQFTTTQAVIPKLEYYPPSYSLSPPNIFPYMLTNQNVRKAFFLSMYSDNLILPEEDQFSPLILREEHKLWRLWTWREIIPSGIWSPASSRNLRTPRKICYTSSSWLNSEDSGRKFAETLVIFYCITWPHLPWQFHWTTAPESNRQCKRTTFEPGKLRLIHQKIRVMFVYVKVGHKLLRLYPSTERSCFNLLILFPYHSISRELSSAQNRIELRLT